MSESSASLIKRLLWITNILFHQVAAVLLIYIWTVIFENYEIDSYATWHVILTSLGYIVLMCEALNVFFGHNLYTIYVPRNKKYLIHLTLMGLSAVLITSGIALKISSKSGNHFTTTHGILGLCALIFLWISVIFGIVNANVKFVKNYIKPVWVKLAHNLIGMLTLCLGISTLGYGMYKDFAFVIFSRQHTVEAGVIALALYATWAMIPPCRSAYHQIVSLF